MRTSLAGSIKRRTAAADIGRLSPPGALLVVSLLLCLAVVAAPASADVTTRAPLAFSPITGAGSGVTIHLPSGIAVEASSGNVFLNDGSGGDQVVALGAEGGSPTGLVPPFAIGGFAFGGEPTGAAVDNSTDVGDPAKGTLYIADTGNREVKKFVRNAGTETYEASGTLTATPAFGEVLGVAVDTHGNVFVADWDNKAVVKFNPTGVEVGRIATTALPEERPSSVAVDAAGDLFVQGYSSPNPVFKWAANGSGEIEPSTEPVEVPGVTGATGVAVDTVTNDLLVAQGSHVTEYDATTLAPGADFGAGTLGNTARLAVNLANHRVYVSDNAAGKENVTVFGPLQAFADATATPTAATEITPESAKIGATITDNNTLPTSWRMEISADGGASWTAAKDGSTPIAGTTDGGQTGLGVSGVVTGLAPNATYQVRVVTNKGSGVATEVASSSLSFTTLAVPPVVSDVGVVDVGDTSVRMVGTIDPRHSSTSYVFQYGTSPALGASTDPVAVGDGVTPVIVSRVVGGLSPNTTYYFKLVATSTPGPAASATESFATRLLPLPLPDGRAYEQVSPPEKSGGGALSGGKLATVSEDDEAIEFGTTSLFGTPPGVQAWMTAPYVSRRAVGGWQTRAATPSFCRIALDAPEVVGSLNQVAMFSPNLDKVAFGQPESSACSIPPLDPAATTPATNLYLGNLGAASSSYKLLSPQRNFAPPFFGLSPTSASGFAVGYSSDFSHVIFSSSGNQTSDSPTPGNFQKLYEWENGTRTLISRDTSGAPFTTNSGVFYQSAANAVSTNGSRIFFQNPTDFNGASCAGNCDLYLREGGTTYRVSQSECTSACGGSQPSLFAWASKDGSKAFFSSAAKLTDDVNSIAGPNLYLFTGGPDPAGEPHNLTLLSRDLEPADGPNPEVQGVIGASDDGTTVFFAAKGQIVSGAPTAPGPKLYRWRWNGGSPTVDYLGTLANAGSIEAENWTLPTVNLFANEGRRGYFRVTPDGQYLLVSSVQKLDPVADHDADADLYRWDQAGGWACVTCQAPGAPSAGNSGGPQTGVDGGRRSVVISDDGQRVFFLTPDALVPQDVNGTVKDVYEWHDGTVSLISSGKDQKDVKLLGASHSGKDVFFYTEEALVGWDSDETGDIYDARIGGGFPEPKADPVPCAIAESCHGPGTSPPGGTGAGTHSFEGPGNKVEPARCPKGKKKAMVKGRVVCKKKHAKKHHKGKKHQRRRGGANRGAGK